MKNIVCNGFIEIDYACPYFSSLALTPIVFNYSFLSELEFKIFQIQMNSDRSYFDLIIGEEFTEECVWIKSVLFVIDSYMTPFWVGTVKSITINDEIMVENNRYNLLY